MERSEMFSPTSCDLSHVTNVYNETDSNEDTESGHCTSTLLAPVAILGFNVEHLISGIFEWELL